jgi:hypothetical protein
MNHQLNDLHLRRGRLLERIAGQRATLGQELEPLAAALDTTDRLLARAHAAINYLKAHPAVVGIAFAALLITKPRRTLRWSRRTYAVWQTWRVLRERMTVAMSR